MLLFHLHPTPSISLFCYHNNNLLQFSFYHFHRTQHNVLVNGRKNNWLLSLYFLFHPNIPIYHSVVLLYIVLLFFVCRPFHTTRQNPHPFFQECSFLCQPQPIRACHNISICHV